MDKSFPLISLIVPIYNTGQVMDRCVESILRQDYPNIEVLLIDDGSIDNTPKHGRLWSERDTRVRSFRIPHGGVSAARNAGIEKAQGAYITFVDADDEVVPSVLFHAFKAMKQNGCDTVCWNAWKHSGKCREPMNSIQNGLIIGSDKRRLLIEALYYYNEEGFYLGELIRSACIKLFSAKIIQEHGILFPEDLPLGEDAAFIARYFCFNKRTLFLNEYGYVYYYDHGSAVGRYRENLRLILYQEYKHMYEILGSVPDLRRQDVMFRYSVACKRLVAGNAFKRSMNVYLAYREMYLFLQDFIILLGDFDQVHVRNAKEKLRLWLARGRYIRADAILETVLAMKNHMFGKKR